MVSKLIKSMLLATSLVALSTFAFAETDEKAENSSRVVLNGKNLVVIKGEIDDESVAIAASQLLESDGKEITIFISSPGGSIVAGNSLISIMKGSGKKTRCIASEAVSMAFVIFQACDERLVLENSIVMQHEASYGLKGQAPNNRSMLNFIESMLKTMDKAQADRIGLSYAEFKSRTRNDWWLFGSAAVDNDVADSLVSVTCSPELSKKHTKQTLRGFFISAEVEWSGCPLVDGPLKVDVKAFTPFGGKSESQALDELLSKYKVRQRVTEQAGLSTKSN